jgi:UDP-N-acetyl-D-glucosamine dehydrogenase
LLRQMGAPVHPVSSTHAAELTKLLENTFRAVNIALVNELALLSERMGIDLWEVIEAAKTKPFGFMPFYPGPGVGGHCIPVDPYYLVYRAEELGYHPRVILAGRAINDYMPRHIAEMTVSALKYVGRQIKGARVLIMGLTYKENVADTRETPAAC